MSKPARILESEGAERSARVSQMFAQIAPSYDRVNTFFTMNRDARWRQAVVSGLKLLPGDLVLDLCCGTGKFFEPLVKATGNPSRVIGADFCLPMLERRDPATKVNVLQADAMNLPLPDSVFDAVTVGWGLRNVVDLERSLSEILRVLKPGGRLGVVEAVQAPNGILGTLTRPFARLSPILIGALSGQGSSYVYLSRSMSKFGTAEQFCARCKRLGFIDVRLESRAFGNICLVWATKP